MTLRGCSQYDTRMSFIPEWVSFQNEVRTAFTWQNRPAQPSWKRPFCPPFWKRYACATRPRLHGLRFHLGTEFCFQFTWYQSEISYQNENFIRIENRDEPILERLVQAKGRNFVTVSCKQIQRNIWGWNELVLEWKSFQYHVNGP